MAYAALFVPASSSFEEAGFCSPNRACTRLMRSVLRARECPTFFLVLLVRGQCCQSRFAMSEVERVHDHRTAQDLVIVVAVLVAAICCRNYLMASTAITHRSIEQQVELGER